MQQGFCVELDRKILLDSPLVKQGSSIDYMLDTHNYIYFGESHQKDNDELEQKKNEQSIEQKQTLPKKKINFSLKKNKKAEQKVEESGKILILDEKNEWRDDNGGNKGPSSRINYYSVYREPYLLIMGGQSNENKILQDLFGYNTIKKVWNRFYFMEGPQGRLHGQLVQSIQRVGDIRSNLIYLIGGVTQPENYILNDIWQLCLENVPFEGQSYELPGLQWTELEVDDMMALKGHQAFMIDNNFISIFGGYNQKGEANNDMYLVNLFENSCQKIEMKGEVPCCRAYHKIVHLRNSLFVMFGGKRNNENNEDILLNDIYIFDYENLFWQKPIIGGIQPDELHSVAIASNKSRTNNQVIILGGQGYNGVVSQKIYVIQQNKGLKWEIKKDDETVQIDSDDMVIDTEGLLGGRIKPNHTNTLVDPDTLHMNQAENIINDQKKSIMDKEQELKNIRKQFKELKQQMLVNNENQKHKMWDYDTQIEQLQQMIAKKKQEEQTNSEFLKKQIELYFGEKKKRKLESVKCKHLQENIRHSENYIISLDMFYQQGIRNEAFTDIIKENVFDELYQGKINHRTILQNFSEEIQKQFQKESTIKEVIRQQQSHVEMKNFFRQQLSKEEKQMMNLT